MSKNGKKTDGLNETEVLLVKLCIFVSVVMAIVFGYYYVSLFNQLETDCDKITYEDMNSDFKYVRGAFIRAGIVGNNPSNSEINDVKISGFSTKFVEEGYGKCVANIKYTTPNLNEVQEASADITTDAIDIILEKK